MLLSLMFACAPDDKDSAEIPLPQSPTTTTCAPNGAEAIRWSSGPAVSARDHHATWVHSSGRLLVLGGYRADGNSGDYLDDVWSISLNVGSDGTTDGGLGSAWEEGPRLPLTLAAPVVVEVEGRVWLTGGKRSNLAGTTDTVLSAAVDADGVPHDWEEAPALGVSRWHHAAVAVGTRLYVVGGQVDNNVATEDVVMADVSGGALEAWQAQAPLPEATSHNAVVVVGDTLYSIGGLQDARFTDTIWRSDIGADGTLGPWEAAGTLPRALATHAALVIDGAVWVIGGVEANGDLPTVVWRVIPGEDGALEDWEDRGEPLPEGISHVHQIPCWNGHVYAVGGKSADGESLTELRVGTLEG